VPELFGFVDGEGRAGFVAAGFAAGIWGPWVPLLRASAEEMEEAMRRLDVADENALRTRLFLLGGLRYGS